MGEPSTMVIQGLDTDGFGAPPNVTFTFRDDHLQMAAQPPGASILIDAIDGTDRVLTSRVRLVDTAAGLMVADITLQHLNEPRWEEWKDAANYAGEVACALYWSMWRRTKLREREAALPHPAERGRG